MELYEYIKAHSSKESEALKWVEKQTHLRTNHARMLSGAVLGEFLQMIVKMIRPERILEIGSFTGYSAICLASALKELEVEGATNLWDCRLDTLEINDELEDVIFGGLERAGVDNIVKVHFGDAKENLAKLFNTGAKYDLIYIDANKREYCQYYDLCFDMLSKGGYILADNVLWDGKVYQNPLPQDKQTQELAKFNSRIASDPRVESVILPIRDGVNLIRKK